MADNGGGGGKRVMVGIDESENGYHALMWALENLKEVSSLVIFSAHPKPVYNHAYAASMGAARLYSTVNPVPEYVNSTQERQKKVIFGILEKARAICATHSVENVETIMEVGDMKVAICDAVERLHVGLLVLGEHHLGKLRRAFEWSVSNYCVLYAKCPVVVVKKPN